MYFTFYAHPTIKKVTFEELLNNPYMTLDSITDNNLKKITVKVTKKYANNYYNKHKIPYVFPYDSTIKTLNTAEHYKHFEIPKKSNPHKKRPIDAPDEMLKNIQAYYKTYIDCGLHVLPHKAAHAYVEKRSTVTAMQEHQKNKSKWFLQLDLKDFFNSIDENFLRNMLLKIYPFAFIDPQQLENLIKVSLLNGILPQGSRLSPTLTNLVMVPIDYDITETLHNYNKHHYVYTRYADDITISCKYKFDGNEIIEIIKNIFDNWKVPFKINEEKTRFGSSAGRNYHVGLILNKDNKISVGHEKNNKFRAMIFNFCTVGEEWDISQVQHMLGLISYYKAVEPDFIEHTINKYNQKFNIDIMEKAKNMLK